MGCRPPNDCYEKWERIGVICGYTWVQWFFVQLHSHVNNHRKCVDSKQSRLAVTLSSDSWPCYGALVLDLEPQTRGILGSSKTLENTKKTKKTKVSSKSRDLTQPNLLKSLVFLVFLVFPRVLPFPRKVANPREYQKNQKNQSFQQMAGSHPIHIC